jgi:hypothetical protein
MTSVPDGARKHRTRLTVLVYRREMPGRKRPTPEDAMTARHALLDGFARDADIFDLSLVISLVPEICLWFQIVDDALVATETSDCT